MLLCEEYNHPECLHTDAHMTDFRIFCVEWTCLCGDRCREVPWPEEREKKEILKYALYFDGENGMELIASL